MPICISGQRRRLRVLGSFLVKTRLCWVLSGSLHLSMPWWADRSDDHVWNSALALIRKLIGMKENMLRVVSYIFLMYKAKWWWWQVLSKEVGRACSVREPIDSKVNFHQLTQRWILWWIFINSHIVVIFNFSPPPHYHTWISEKVSLICVTLEMQSPGGLPPLGDVIRPWPPLDII